MIDLIDIYLTAIVLILAELVLNTMSCSGRSHIAAIVLMTFALTVVYVGHAVNARRKAKP
jgi:hypothetical protein